MSVAQRVSLWETNARQCNSKAAQSPGPARPGSAMRREQRSLDTLRGDHMSGLRSSQNDLRAVGRAASLPPKISQIESRGAPAADTRNKNGSSEAATGAKRSLSASVLAYAKSWKNRLHRSMSAVRSKVQTPRSKKTKCSPSFSGARRTGQDQPVRHNQRSIPTSCKSNQETGDRSTSWDKCNRDQQHCQKNRSSKIDRGQFNGKCQSNNDLYPNLLSGGSPFEERDGDGNRQLGREIWKQSMEEKETKARSRHMDKCRSQENSYLGFSPAARVREEKQQWQNNQSREGQQRLFSFVDQVVAARQAGHRSPRHNTDKFKAPIGQYTDEWRKIMQEADAGAEGIVRDDIIVRPSPGYPLSGMMPSGRNQHAQRNPKSLEEQRQPKRLPNPNQQPSPAGYQLSNHNSNLQARVNAEIAKLGGASPVVGEGLVRLYNDSGLGGGAHTKCQSHGNMNDFLLCLASQRMNDLSIDQLRRSSFGKQVPVHFPHLSINLQQRTCCDMISGPVQVEIERRIRSGQRLTCMQKAYVLRSPHIKSIEYTLAYALMRARITRRSGSIWMPLAMSTSDGAHANGVCLQSVGGNADRIQVLVYDPNYTENGSNYLHVKKAMDDAIPGVQRLLQGSRITLVPQAELFGHGLQTLLGTTEEDLVLGDTLLSDMVMVTKVGFPICGAVVQLLAWVWSGVASGGDVLDDIRDVEWALAQIVQEEKGKLAVQKKISALLQDLRSPRKDPFATVMQRKLGKDKDEILGMNDINALAMDKGGNISMQLGVHHCKYTW